MTNKDDCHHIDPDAYRTIGRARHREDLAEDFRRLDAAQRDAAAAASPSGRALIESSRAATYDRLAPLVAELDRTWNPATVANTAADTVPNAPAVRTPRFDRYARPSTSADTVQTITTTDTDNTAVPAPTMLDERPDDRNRIVDIVVKAAQVVRHPRRRRQG